MVTGGGYWLVLLASALLNRVLPARWRRGFLALVSLAYLAALDPFSCGAAAAWLLVVYALVSRRDPALVERWTGPLIGCLLAYLACFKYLVPALSLSEGQLPAVIPLGISYFTFKLGDLVLQVARREIPPELPWDRLLLHFFLFPAYAAGPMARYPTVEPAARVTAATLAAGLTRIAHGIVKRFLFAEAVRELWLSELPAWMAHAAKATPSGAWAMVICQFAFVYLDFSACADVAIGSALLLGIQLPENFDHPLLATNLSEFWQRWHMTLTHLCRRHVYQPVLGATRNVPLSIFVTMTVIALWHGASVGRLLWGFYQAAGLCLFGLYRRVAGANRPDGRLARVAGWLLTFAFFTSAQAFTMIEGGDWRQAVRVLGRLVGL